MKTNKTQHLRQHLLGWAVCRVAAALCLAATAGSAAVIGNDLTGVPNGPEGDTGNVLIVDGFHNPGVTPNFTIPGGGGVLSMATLLNDSDSNPESVDLLVLRPNGDGSYTVIHRVTITDDTPEANSGTTDYPLANLPVQPGDLLAHWGLGNQPIALDCCGTGPGDVQISNLDSANFDVGNTFTFAPFPQARSYYWNVTLVQGDADNDGLDDQWELTYASNLTNLNGKGVGPGPGAGTGDFDGDGLLDIAEAARGTDPTKPDTDGDTLSDGAEVLGAGLRPPTSPTKADTDGDGLSDLAETNDGTFNGPTDTGTNPTKSDTDGDGLTDGVETNDGTFNDPTDTGTDPNKTDTDGDGYSDGLEISAGTDPTNPNDPPRVQSTGLRIIGNDLTGVPNGPGGDSGSVLIVDGYHNPTPPNFTIPAGGGVLTKATLLNDSDSNPESVDLLVLRPSTNGTYTVIHRVTITDDTPVANSGTNDYPLANLPVEEGDVLAHWGDGSQPIPNDCCGSGPGDVQISNLASANFDVGKTFTFAPFPQARSYYWNVTLLQTIVGNDLTHRLPNQPEGDTGNVLIVDGFHNPGVTPSFTIPAGGGVLTMATLLNDTDSNPESVDLLVLRPSTNGTYTVIHRVTITDDTPEAISGTTDYPLANLLVRAGDMLAHWGLGQQPIPNDCCGTGPGDVQISNLDSANFDVGNTFTFAPYPQARSYYWNVTFAPSKDTDDDGLDDQWELTYAGNLTSLNGKGVGPGPGAGTGDFDGDGLLDIDEMKQGTDPTKPDTDGDTLSDGAEVLGAGLRPPTSPTKADTDADGLTDGVETNDATFNGPTDTGTNPTKSDTDGDGLTDPVETNTGLFNGPLDTGTDPNKLDTDGDGYSDGKEVGAGTDPTNPNDPANFSGEIIGNDLTGVPNGPEGDTGSVLIVDGYHNPTPPNFTIPAEGFLTKATLLNDTDSAPESVDLLVLRPNGVDNYTVIHRVTITDDTPAANTGTNDYPLANLPVQAGDVLAHWGAGSQPIPSDCCGSGPGDVQISNLGSANFDVGKTFTFAPFPQARSYYWNVTLVRNEIIVGNDLTGTPNGPEGDTGNVLIVDGYHNPTPPNFTIPAGGGFLTKATVLNDTDSNPESVDLLVLRPSTNGTYTVIHRVTITDDTPVVADSGTNDYPLANLPVQAGDVLAHWGLGNQPIPQDCCGSGPGDVQISNLGSANFDVGKTFTFAPFPQARSYYWNVTLSRAEPTPLRVVLTTVDRLTGNVTLNWNSTLGTKYILQYKDDLSVPGTPPDYGWVAVLPGLSSPVVGTGGVVSLTDVGVTASQRFYRVRVVP